ncbi:uncharacterized protein LOC117544657 [Gymnodraco acuticeps]|uniref:Uncharacterized protein LOC117544657 n=1 Tax=Gymnodraco acuticeps TaxID=8218 RepID=A0A6P8TZD5_GYMAC|nr:uncharacterized protein LOC117544657 [Gymnodraco acuticeps]
MDENGRDITCLDPIATAALKAANISRDMLPSLSKEDLRDLLPGPEHFRRRRTIWRLNHDENEGQETDLCRPSTSHGTCDFSPIPTPQPSLFPSSSSSCPNPSPSPVFSPPSFSSQSPQPQHGASRTVQLPSPLYVLYTDTELEQSRSTFSEKQRAGEEGDYVLSKDLRCRLIRNTVTSMLSIKRAAGDDFNYPCSRELTVMAKRLIEYYPMLRDRSQTSRAEWVCHYSSFQLMVQTKHCNHLPIKLGVMCFIQFNKSSVQLLVWCILFDTSLFYVSYNRTCCMSVL